MAAMDFLTPFYDRRHTRDTLVADLDGVLTTHASTVRALPFYSSAHPALWLDTAGTSRFSISPIHPSEGVSLFACRLLTKDSEGRERSHDGRFFIWDHPEYPKIHVLLTLEASFVFDRLHRLIERWFPRAVTTFITHRHLRRLLDSFRDEHQLSALVIKRASFRVRFEEHDPSRPRRVLPVVSWPDLELHEAFDWVYQQNGWFQSLQFDARRHQNTLATISFTRQGITRTTGLFPQVFAGFVEPVCKTIDENVRVFGQRSRRDRRDLSVRPLVIEFETDQIAESDERHRFVQAMKRLRAASVSVLHGNPYVHLSVLDYYDGSVFDIWVLSGNNITIVPQMKGTVAAIKRVIHHIFDSYAEGRMKEYAEAQG